MKLYNHKNIQQIPKQARLLSAENEEYLCEECQEVTRITLVSNIPRDV